MLDLLIGGFAISNNNGFMFVKNLISHYKVAMKGGRREFSLRGGGAAVGISPINEGGVGV